MLLRLLTPLITTILLTAAPIQLQKNYYINGKKVLLSNITKSPKNKEILFNINSEKHIKRVKSKELIKLLKKYDIQAQTHHSYIQFTQKSPIDTHAIEASIVKYYKTHYPTITIKSLLVQPRAFLTHLPTYVTLKFQKRAYLKNYGVVALITEDRKEVFFNYTLNATVRVYKARKKIQRAEEISAINVKLSTISLQKLLDTPLTDITHHYQAKHILKEDTIITMRDVAPLVVVKRGDIVNAFLQSGSVEISFSAKAQQNGTISDIITIETDQGKKLKAQVLGRNRVKVQ